MNLKKMAAGFTATAIMLSAVSFFPKGYVSAANECVIDTSIEYQTIDGFGGMNHPEWTGKDLTDAQRQKVFGNGDDELGFSILRVFVNPESNQWYKAVPTAKFAQEQGAKVFASPWEPPAQLAESGGSSGKLHIPESNYAAYAKHLNDFGSYMKSQGVDLYSISVQNEPDYASEWTAWSTDETTNFLANYADKITSTRVMSPESFQYAPENASWVADGGKKYYTKILNNSKAFANCDLFGTHFYGTQRAWMDFPALESCGKPIWMTEVYTDSKNDADLWPMALDVSENIHNGLVVGNMSAYVWWYIRRSYGPLKENGTISKRGYCMAQYSKFVRPGDVRIDATEQPADNVYVSAYKGNDNQMTIVAINKGTESYAQQFSVSSDSQITDIDRYRTSSTENIAKTENLSYTDNSFWAQLPAESVSTFVVTLSEKSIEPDENGYYFHDEFEDSVIDWESRGANKLGLSGRTPYKGGNALLVSERTGAWNGAQKELTPAMGFKPGESYSFSACVKFVDGLCTERFSLTLQYTDADGKTQYKNIDNKVAVRGEYVQLANTSYTIPADASNVNLVVETASQTMNFYMDEVIGAVKGTKIEGPAEVSFVLGDVNYDGIINVFDLCLGKKGIIKGFADNLTSVAADVDQNGVVDGSDVMLMQQFLTGEITEFPVGKKTVTPADYMNAISANIVEKEPSTALEEKAGVTYGTIEKKTFYSDICKRNKNVNILLPANYSKDKKYPVLYALHGYFGNEDALLDAGDASLKLRQIIGNAIAEGEAEEMIVVFPDIFASSTQDACSGFSDESNAAYDNFINVLVKEIMPYMEKNYSIKTGRENTAITGFSMGGRESLYIGFSRPDLFGYIGATCPAPGLTTDLFNEGDLKFTSNEPYLLLLSAGSTDDIVHSVPEGYHNAMTANGTTHLWHYVIGGYHGGNTIRPHIYNFVRALFKA